MRAIIWSITALALIGCANERKTEVERPSGRADMPLAEVHEPRIKAVVIGGQEEGVVRTQSSIQYIVHGLWKRGAGSWQEPTPTPSSVIELQRQQASEGAPHGRN